MAQNTIRLYGAPASFQCFIDRVVKGMEEYVAIYLNDIVVFSATWKDHLIQVKNMLKLQRLDKPNLITKPNKCQVGMRWTSSGERTGDSEQI